MAESPTAAKVEIICRNGHKWNVVATDYGMARPDPNSPSGNSAIVIFDRPDCDLCGMPGRLASARQSADLDRNGDAE